MNSHLSEVERASWAATKLQARFRGRKTREATKSKSIAKLKVRVSFFISIMRGFSFAAGSTEGRQSFPFLFCCCCSIGSLSLSHKYCVFLCLPFLSLTSLFHFFLFLFLVSHSPLSHQAHMGLGLMVTSRISQFAQSRSKDFIRELEEEKVGHSAAAILHEATGETKIRANDIEMTRLLIEGKTLKEIEEHKAAKEQQQLDSFEMDDEVVQKSKDSTEVVQGISLFVKEFPVYPKLVVSFEAHNDEDDNEGVIVQRCWCEVPPKDKPMRMLRVRQDQLDDATKPIPRHGGEYEQDDSGMSEGGFSSDSSSLGDSDDLGALYEEEDSELEDLELSTNLHDLV